MSHFFGDFWWLTLILGFVELLLLLSLPLGLFNAFQWEIPFLDWLYRRRHTALILRSLGLSIEGGKPILDGLFSLTRDYPSAWVRDRLTLAARDIRDGENWVESLRSRQLISRTDSAVIASAERVGNLVWALEETAAASERRVGYQLQFLIQTLFPVLVLAMGVFVLIFCVAYFSPVVRLIERLSG